MCIRVAANMDYCGALRNRDRAILLTSWCISPATDFGKPSRGASGMLAEPSSRRAGDLGLVQDREKQGRWHNGTGVAKRLITLPTA